VLVTLGAQGVLWAGPTDQLSDMEISGTRHVIHRAIEIDAFFSWIHLPALSIEGKSLHSTSGAGDAFVAGVVAHMVREKEKYDGLHYEAVIEGLRAARNHLMKS